MIAFQPDAFQYDAFQVAYDRIPAISDNSWLPKEKKWKFVSSTIVPPKPPPLRSTQDYEEMKLSNTLIIQLNKSYEENKRLQAERDRTQNVLNVIQKELGVTIPQPEKIQTASPVPSATIIPPITKPPMDPQKRAILMQRLDKANEARERERERQEAIAKQRLKNLAKARRVARKNRDK